MNIPTALKLFSILLFWVTGGFSQEEASASKNNLQLVKVASLNTIDANKEFQKMSNWCSSKGL